MKKVYRTLLALCCLVSWQQTWATNKTWVGANVTSPSWNTANYWSPTGVPGSGDAVTIPATLTGSNKFPNIGAGLNAQCASITFSSGGSVYPRLSFSGSGNLTIFGAFTNNAGSNILTGGTSTGAVIKLDRSIASPPTISITGSCTFRKLTIISTSSATGHSYTVDIPSGTTIGITEYIEVTKGTGSGASATLSGSGVIDMLPDLSTPVTPYVRAGSTFGNGTISCSTNVRAVTYKWSNTDPTNSYDDGERYHYLGNPITDNKPYLQLDPQFEYYKPKGYDGAHPTYGHPLYNYQFSAPGMLKPVLSDYNAPLTYQDYLNDFATWARYVEDNTPYWQYYDESVAEATTRQNDDYGYKGISYDPTSPTSPTPQTFGVLQGYMVHGAPNDDGMGTGSVSLGAGGQVTWVGTVNNGSQSMSITHTSTGGTYDGRNLVGNPFPSPIDWQAIYNSHSSNYNPSIQVWNGGGSGSGSGPDAGTFQVYTACTTGCTSPQIPIALGQGFFVTATSTNTMTLTNSHRMADATQFLYRQGVQENALNVQVAGVGNRDKAMFRFIDATSPDYDPATDLGKIMNPGNSIYSLCKQGPLHLNYLPYPQDLYTVPLELKLKKEGTYEISAQDATLDMNTYIAVLEDKLLGKKILLTTTNKYAFYAKDGITRDRFTITFGRRSEAKELLASTDLKMTAFTGENGNIRLSLSDNSITEATLTVMDLTGKTAYSSNVTFNGGSASIPNPGLPSGLYMVSLITQQGPISDKVYLAGK